MSQIIKNTITHSNCYWLLIGIIVVFLFQNSQDTKLLAQDTHNIDTSAHTYDLLQYITKNNLSLSWDDKYNIGLIRKDNTIVSFQPSFPIILINFTGQIILEPIIKERGRLIATKNFIDTLDTIFIYHTYQTPDSSFSSNTNNTEQNSTNDTENSNIKKKYNQNNTKILNSSLKDNNIPQSSTIQKNLRSSSKFSRIVTLVIDPGHGGKTPGAVGRFTYKNKPYRIMEKDIVLEVSLLVSKQLQKKYPNVNVIMTRKNDTYISLENRTIIANKYLNQLNEGEGMIFVSIHANAALTSNASGYEVWYLPPDYRRDNLIEKEFNHSQIYSIINNIREEEITLESIQLANFIIGGLKKQIGNLSKNRGIKEEKFYVVRNTKMPAILIELGFITNPEEGYNLTLQPYKKKLSDGIVNGLEKYLELF